ncbi:hypothetical protein PCANC_28749, partial [Puccinia coronata f. sp. avenae]
MSQKPAFIGNSSYPVLSFGLFDIHEIDTSELSARAESSHLSYKSNALFLRKNRNITLEVKLHTFSSRIDALKKDHVYFVCGKWVAHGNPTSPEPAMLNFDRAHAFPLGPSNQFNFTNSVCTPVAAFGTVSARSLVSPLPSHPSNCDLNFVMKHSNHDSYTARKVSFSVKYHASGESTLHRAFGLIQANREVQIFGFISSYIQAEHLLQVEASVPSTSGSPSTSMLIFNH